MEIQALAGRQAVKSVTEVSSQIGRGEGVSFLGMVAEAVKEGKIVMPGGSEMSKLDFNKAKFSIDGGLSKDETEEEQVKSFLTRIKNILEKKGK